MATIMNNECNPNDESSEAGPTAPTLLTATPGGSFVSEGTLVAADPSVIDVDGVHISPAVPGLWMSFALTARVEGWQSLHTKVAQLVVMNHSIVKERFPDFSSACDTSQRVDFFSLPWRPLTCESSSTESNKGELVVNSGHAGVFSGSTIPQESDGWFEPWLELATDLGTIAMTGGMPGPVGAVVNFGSVLGVCHVDVCKDEDGRVWGCRIVSPDEDV
eukprot:GHVN01050533.1.p1 GENE.GHVN01050533.1~~GHVN01050533.1.p1  ORF type:complete len:218 (+),score=23.79 GHVN01050533.1:216-869(+)